MTVAGPVKTEMLKAIPSLRAFAISLCGNSDGADDLVQETLVKAWANIGSFTEGSNMPAWLFTILRNVFYSQYRKRRREVDDPEGEYASKLASAPDQHSHMEFMDLKAALQKLPADQREALILVGASGLSYEDAASICGCAIGTMKSRVNRARGRLAELLSLAPGDGYGADARWSAAIDHQLLAVNE
ncbi:MAG: sigma-70 family RNA polymerase sigma factor [Hyphomicrobiales bacterium]